MIEKNKTLKEKDDIFDYLKISVAEDSIKRHNWEEKAAQVLVSIDIFGFIPNKTEFYSESVSSN